MEVTIIDSQPMEPYMARRTSNKIEPAVLTVSLLTPTVPNGAVGEFTADLSQIASLVNRRFYRQGLNWAVAGIKVLTTDFGNVQVQKLPNTWTTSGAWEKTMRTWLRQQNEAVDEAGLQSAVAKFRDFKIHMDATHVNAGFATNLLPIDGANNPYAVGEWNESLVVVPNANGVVGNTQEYYLHMVGDNDPAPDQSKSMIKAYSESRSVPQSPDPVTLPGAEDSLFVEMFDTGLDQEQVVDNAIDRNDNLPYPQMDYPGGPIQAPTLEYHDGAKVTASTIGGTTRLKGGNFPCGLMRVLWNPLAETSSIRIEIDLVPGTHRGYLVEPMMEM